MASPVSGRSGDNRRLSPEHRPRCLAYRAAYREAYGRLTAAVCCCCPDDEPVSSPRTIGLTVDMPCALCLLWISTPHDQRPSQIYAIPYGATAERDASPLIVRGWAMAEELAYGSQYRISDEHGQPFRLEAKTLVGGDALCLPHAVHTMRARAGSPVN